ncbi:reverse transcriptase [Phytophthora megakarya]|uniref:Reverse transcriptase n=1 Tax=Phytophthora megakarya TaxID=4795 RepID=A0A225VW35_9STRA|nr:reverse transcriptase [Phytophthora megakarya]
MDFMVPAGIRLDLTHGSISLPDEVRFQLSGRRQVCSDKARIVNLGQYLRIQPGASAELPIRLRTSDHEKFWVTRGDHWIPTIVHGPGRIRYMRITNIGDKVLILHQDLRIGIWLAGDHVPRLPGFISVGSRRYMEWDPGATWSGKIRPSKRPWIPDLRTRIRMRKIHQGLQWNAPSMRFRVQRPRPTAIKCLKGGSSGDQEVSDHLPLDNSPSDNPPLDCRPLDEASVASDGSDLSSIADDNSMSHVVTVVRALDDQDPGVSGITAADLPPVEDPAVETVLAEETPSGVTGADQDPPVQEVQDPKPAMLKGDGSHPSSLMGVESGTSHKLGDPLDQKDTMSMSQKRDADPAAVLEDQPNISDLDLTWDSDQDYDECVYYNEGSDLYAEDVDGQLAVLAEVPATTEDVRIEDTQLCGSDNQTPEEIDRLPQRIWKSSVDRAQVSKAAAPVPKLAEQIKGLLSAKMINHSRSPWASPIVVIIKKNGVDIRLCIDYRLVNSLTQLMVYPMPLINDLLEDLESTLGYCSLDMASGFWVVKMTDRARLISAFITPFGLFEWNPMPFGLKKAPRFIEDNAVYASVLYELREIDYAAMEKGMNRSRIQLALASESPDPDILTKDPTRPQPSDPSPRGPDPGLNDQDPNLAPRDPTPDCVKTSNPKSDNLADLDPRWVHAHRSFKVLKEKIAKTPILREFDPDRQAVVVVYASDWAISGALMQEYDQVYYPVMFAIRTLKSNELNYGIAEKEVLAVLRVLDLNYNTLVGRPIRVLTRHSTLAWLFRSNALQGRLGQWAALLSPWILEIVKCNKGEDEILGALAARITPRSDVDKALISITPKKEPRRKIQAPIPTVRSDEDLYVASFDGSARVKRGGGAYSAILWKLPEWTVVKARSGYAEEIHIGGSDPDGKYTKTGSGSTEVAISDPEALPTGTGAGVSVLTGGDLRSGGSAQRHKGYTKKLAHVWHGPFRVAEKIGEYAVKLEITGSAYNFPIVHDQDRLDFHEALLPGDSWTQVRDPDEYEVEMISDMGTGRKTSVPKSTKGNIRDTKETDHEVCSRSEMMWKWITEYGLCKI